jgi:hypothetical protein
VTRLSDQRGRIFPSGRADSDRCDPVKIDPVLLGFTRSASGAERYSHHPLYEDACRMNDYVGTIWWQLVPLTLLSSEVSRPFAMDTTVSVGVVRDG